MLYIKYKKYFTRWQYERQFLQRFRRNETHLNEINKIPLLSNEKEVELAKKAASGDKAARDLLVSSNMRFVVNVAKSTRTGVLILKTL